MKKVFLIIMLCIVGNVFSQNKGTIVGKVSDIALNDEPILFAQVQLKNSNHTAQTNFHGNFELADVIPGEYTLVFSFLGYETKEIAVLVKDNETVRINGHLKTKIVEIDTAFEDELAMSQKTTFQEKNPLK
ncbi:carboxypeptidase-like regulatory domain-containing protein [Cellulophaga baltica]|uniref:carboxypeptidase-like regulatory domain-containing protein n=1 Tax=Cellulophaga TaxID=104264 RepID=UPI001C07488E|nr:MULTISPECIES: carboxypeptidase-like regulatory domain-containing protein [Cellulophaga]MBU2997672.1 carboxypeptidase-like regulatory domain-containing protein [Cellulophaga baltica]MDO6769067.1 carboxypeptidase-like regulatory domain-containing protein [Cellulophaga sp. 1_MG-2023]